MDSKKTVPYDEMVYFCHVYARVYYQCLYLERFYSAFSASRKNALILFNNLGVIFMYIVYIEVYIFG